MKKGRSITRSNRKVLSQSSYYIIDRIHMPPQILYSYACTDVKSKKSSTIFSWLRTFALSILDCRFHDINVFARCNTLVIKVKSLLNLLTKFLPKNSSTTICTTEGYNKIIYAKKKKTATHKNRKVSQPNICMRKAQTHLQSNQCEKQ